MRVGITGGHRRSWGPFRRVYEFGTPTLVRLRPLGEDRLVGPTFDERRGVLVVSRKPGPQVRDVAVDGREISLRVDAGTDIESAVLTGLGQE